MFLHESGTLNEALSQRPASSKKELGDQHVESQSRLTHDRTIAWDEQDVISIGLSVEVFRNRLDCIGSVDS